MGCRGVESLVSLAVKQDFYEIDPLPGQNPITKEIVEQSLLGEAYTIRHDGEILAIMGTYTVWPGRAVCWAFMGKPSRRKMLILTRQVFKYIANTPVTRLEAHILKGFTPGIRWAVMFGFEYEGEMRKFDGVDDYIMMSRVQ